MAKKNYSYGRIENGRLEYAPNMLIVTLIDEYSNEYQAQVFNATAEQYTSQGWLPVVKSQQPEATENGYYIPTYERTNGQIVQSWTFQEYIAQEVSGND